MANSSCPTRSTPYLGRGWRRRSAGHADLLLRRRVRDHAGWTSVRRDGGGTVEFWRKRSRRLLLPTALFLGSWAVVEAIGHLAIFDYRSAVEWGMIVFIPMVPRRLAGIAPPAPRPGEPVVGAAWSVGARDRGERGHHDDVPLAHDRLRRGDRDLRGWGFRLLTERDGSVVGAEAALVLGPAVVLAPLVALFSRAEFGALQLSSVSLQLWAEVGRTMRGGVRPQPGHGSVSMPPMCVRVR